jgi:hypothetical protein
MRRITITIKEPALVTNPPQPDQIKLEIEGIIPTEAIHILLSALSNIGAQELPKIIKAIKEYREPPPHIFAVDGLGTE